MTTPDFSLNRIFQHSEGTGPRLRIGILTDGDTVPNYAARVIEDIAESNFAKICCVVRNALPSPQRKASRYNVLARFYRMVTDERIRSRVLYNLYTSTLERHSNIQPNSHAPTEFRKWTKSARILDVTPRVSGFVHYFPDDAIRELAAMQLDVIVRLGFGILRGDILECAQFGVWSYHHGDNSQYRGGPPLFWEVIERNPISGVVLQRLSPELDAGEVLQKATFSTAGSLSVLQNRFGPYWCTTHFVIQTLNMLHADGWSAVVKARPAAQEYVGRKRLYRAPTNSQMLGWLLPNLGKASYRPAKRLIARLTGRESALHWRIGLRRGHAPLYEQTDKSILNTFHWLTSPHGHFWADPFLIERRGATWLVFEDFDYQSGVATIAAGQVTPDSNLRDIRTVLAPGYHLSYPHVFEHAGEVFMIPESASAGCIQLWRAQDFPNVWKLEQTLLKLSAVDSTPWFDGNCWWLFSSPKPVDNHIAGTFLWTSPALSGKWRLAHKSPICSDVIRARPAGALLNARERLIRPSQDGSGRYGSALWFNEIRKLSQDGYEELPLIRIAPDQDSGVAGFHTYSTTGDWEAIDGQFHMQARRFR